MFWRLLRKDFLVELHSREVSATMLTFGLAVILIFSFAFNESPAVFRTFAPGLYWVMILFISVLGLHRIFTHEKEFDTFSTLISAPIDRGLIYLSKCVAGIAFLTITEILISLPFILFLGIDLPNQWGLLIGLIMIGNIGIMNIGSLVAGLAMRAKMSEVLLPILLFPLVSPLIIALVKASAAILANQSFEYWQFWFQLILTFAVVFGSAGYLLFDHITEE